LGTAQVGLKTLEDFVLAQWGGESLGIYNCREIRNGGKLSLHAEGRAFDWASPNRKAFDAAAAFLIAHSEALNVQALHDYDNQKLWRPGRGWRPGRIGKGPRGEMHIERNWAGARDARAVEAIIGKPQATATDANGANTGNGLAPLVAAINEIKAHELKRDDKGDNVKLVQNLLIKHGAKLKADGTFGQKTEAAVKAFQKGAKLAVDGRVGAKTITALLQQ